MAKKSSNDKRKQDEKLKERLTAALDKSKDMSGYDVNARVVEGKITLQGVVDTLADKNHAHRTAASVEGAGEIDNDITISTDGYVDDGEIDLEILQELEGDPSLEDTRVKVYVNKGEAILTGNVNSAAQKQALQETVSKARGVKSIIDRTSVDTPDAVDDADLVNSIQSIFNAENIMDVQVACKNGVVSLSGQVSVGRRDRALELASQVNGVKKVKGYLIDTHKGELTRAARAAEEIKRSFADFERLPITIHEKDGHLILQGVLSSVEQKRIVDRKLHSVMEEFGREFVAVENKIRLGE